MKHLPEQYDDPFEEYTVGDLINDLYEDFLKFKQHALQKKITPSLATKLQNVAEMLYALKEFLEEISDEDVSGIEAGISPEKETMQDKYSTCIMGAKKFIPCYAALAQAVEYRLFASTYDEWMEKGQRHRSGKLLPAAQEQALRKAESAARVLVEGEAAPYATRQRLSDALAEKRQLIKWLKTTTDIRATLDETNADEISTVRHTNKRFAQMLREILQYPSGSSLVDFYERVYGAKWGTISSVLQNFGEVDDLSDLAVTLEKALLEDIESVRGSILDIYDLEAKIFVQ